MHSGLREISLSCEPHREGWPGFEMGLKCSWTLLAVMPSTLPLVLPQFNRQRGFSRLRGRCTCGWRTVEEMGHTGVLTSVCPLGK